MRNLSLSIQIVNPKRDEKSDSFLIPQLWIDIPYFVFAYGTKMLSVEINATKYYEPQ